MPINLGRQKKVLYKINQEKKKEKLVFASDNAQVNTGFGVTGEFLRGDGVFVDNYPSSESLRRRGYDMIAVSGVIENVDLRGADASGYYPGPR